MIAFLTIFVAVRFGILALVFSFFTNLLLTTLTDHARLLPLVRRAGPRPRRADRCARGVGVPGVAWREGRVRGKPAGRGIDSGTTDCGRRVSSMPFVLGGDAGGRELLPEMRRAGVVGLAAADEHRVGLGRGGGAAARPVFLEGRPAGLVRFDRGRRLHARHGAGRALPDHRAARARRHGRGLSRGRPEARPAGRAEVPAAAIRFGEGPPRAFLRRGPHRAPGLASERLPRLRRRRDRRPALPVDGVRGRRGPRVPAETHRPTAAGQGARDRARALRRARRGARAGRAAPRPEAGQRDARRPGPRAHHGLRPGDRGERGRRGRGLGHPGLHGPGAARREARVGAKRHLLAGPRALRALHGPQGLRQRDAAGAQAQARRGSHPPRRPRSLRASTRPSSA